MATAAERLKQYEDLFQRSQGYDTTKYQQDFEKAYNEAANYNKDLIEQKAGYISQAQALPSQMREQYYTSPIRNPLAQEALIDTRRGALTGDVNRIVDLLAARGARYQDVLGKHMAAYESEAQRAATAAENAWRLYQDALQQDQFNAQLRASRGGGGTTRPQLTLEDILRIAREQGNTQTQTPITPTPTTPDTPYWGALTAAAAWEPENNTLANIYNGLRDTVGKFVYENPTPISFIKKLFNRGK